MKNPSFLVALISSLAITACGQQSLSSSNSQANQNSQIAQQSQTLSNSDIKQIAKEITVLIDGERPGSGFFVSKKGNNYYVLTSKHVVSTPDEYYIVTPDGKRYRIDPQEYDTKVKKIAGVDLAIVEFTSNDSYKIPQLSNTKELTEATTVYVAGFPGSGQSKAELNLTEGLVVSNALATETLKDGYDLIYDNPTLPGMSGGPVLDTRGQIVGIHGRAELNSKDEKTGFNLGVPIQTFWEKNLGSLELPGTPSITKLVDDMFISWFTYILPAKCSSQVNYRSLKLTSPTTSSSVYFEGVNKSCSPPTPSQIFIEQNGNITQTNFTQKTSADYEFESLSPLSFSADGKYLIVVEKKTDGKFYWRTEEYSAGNIFLILDTSKNYEPIPLAPCEGDGLVTIYIKDSPKKITILEDAKFKGFKSPDEAVFKCGDNTQVINFKQLRIQKFSSSESQSFNGEYSFYGSVAALPQVEKR